MSARARLRRFGPAVALLACLVYVHALPSWLWTSLVAVVVVAAVYRVLGIIGRGRR